MSGDFVQPTMSCPRCGAEYDDFDGFGVLFCPKPDGCGFCTHPSRDGIDVDGVPMWKCGLCGDVSP